MGLFRGSSAPGAHLTPPLSADDVLGARFTATKFRDGYTQDEVDDFLDRVVQTLRGVAATPVTAAAARQVKFRSTTFREGYDTDEVDDFLDLVVATLEG